MEVDEAMTSLGFCGRWQGLLYGLILVAIKAPTAWHALSIVWIGYRPPHHCKVPGNSSDWIPLEEDGTLSSCSMYSNPLSSNSSSNNHTTACQGGWYFDTTDSGPTVASKWGLVCQRAYLVQLSQTLLTVGVAVAVVSTRVADRFGRKRVLITNNFLMSLSGLLTAFSYNLPMFFVSRFLVGLFTGGTIMGQLVYLTESFSLRSRAFYTIVGSGFYGLSASLLPLLAFFTANWLHLQVLISLYGLFFVPLVVWWLPETVPWLHANNRLVEAEAVLLRAGRHNKVPFCRPILKATAHRSLLEEDLTIELLNHQKNEEALEKKEEEEGKKENYKKEEKEGEEVKKEKEEEGEEVKKEEEDKKKNKGMHVAVQYSLLDLFTNRYLLRHMTLGIVIFVDNLGYMGITYLSASLSFDRFVSSCLNSLVELPACVIAYLLVNRFGRRKPILLLHVVAAVSIVVCAFTSAYEKRHPDLVSLNLALSIIFKFSVTAAYSVIFIYGTELFPTNLRSQAVGVCLMLGRVGAILAASSSLIFELYPTTLYLTFGVLTLLGGLLTMQLPETSTHALPETVQDIEQWYTQPL